MAKSTAMARSAPSNVSVIRAQEERMAAQQEARRARARAADAREETRLVKRAASAAVRANARAWAGVVSMASLSLVVGLVVGGQLSRVTAGWGRWVERGCLVLGMLTLLMAKKRWHYLLAFSLLGAGGVQLSDWSRKRDLIPGDRDWEDVLPSVTNKQERKVVVIAADKPASN